MQLVFGDPYAFIFTITFTVSQKQTVRDLKRRIKYENKPQAGEILLKQSEHTASFSPRKEAQK